MLSISFGPFVVSPERLVFLSAFAISLLVGWLSGRRVRVTVEPALMQMFFGGVVAGRLAFVVAYWNDYRADLWRIIDIRDGGLWFTVGVVAAALIGLLHSWKYPVIRRHLAAAIVSGVLVWAGGSLWLKNIPQQKTDLTNLQLLGLDEQVIEASSFVGKPLVVNLWATWCAPCRREMPVLAEAQQKQPAFEFVFVSQGEGNAEVSAYLQRETLALRNVFLDPYGNWSQQLGASAMPTTLFFDEQGILRDSHTGELSPATLKEKLKSIEAKKTRP